jgi:hypothetical protein
MLLTLIGCLVILPAFFIDPIAQDPQYHQFADQRNYLSVPNTWNVASNLLFAMVGVAGIFLLSVRRSLVIIDSLYPAYFVFFAALVFIAPGSAYYHWSPDNQSLFWDRLPMTLAFMSFFTIILGERVSRQLARWAFLPLLIVGFVSIVYWAITEQAGSGDLRPYVLVQFLPILMIPLILLIFAPGFNRDGYLWAFLACYLVAKIFEGFDSQIFQWLSQLSGHSLKHVTASVGCLIFLQYLRLRRVE